MAKKTKELSLEEKLEQALVLVDEQPYEVPENWCWTRGYAIFKPMETRKPSGERFKYIDIDSIDNCCQKVSAAKEILTEKAPSRASRAVNDGDTVFSLVRPYLKNIAYIDETLKDCIASTGFYICSSKECVYPKYMYWLMVSPYTVDGLNLFMKGDNSPSIRKDDIEKFPYPLPPIAEQKRIVDTIESMFAKLDEAKEIAEEALEKIQLRCSAIKYQAFSGELTGKWREQNGISKNTWQECNLQEICMTKITDGTHKTPTYCEENEGVPFISSKDVTAGRIDWTNIKYITKELHEELYKRLAPQKDDVLLAKNGTTGIAAIVEDDRIFDLYVTLAVLRPNKDIILPQYLLNVVNSPMCKEQFNAHLTGIGVPNLHLRDIREVTISLPSLDEQMVIIDTVNRVLQSEEKEKQLVAELIEQIDLMKKSILAKAFRGELGTNIESEESSIDLLKEILKGEE